MALEDCASRPSRRAVFVYYKVAASKIARLKEAVAVLVAASVGPRTTASLPWRIELMRRVPDDPSSDLQTWMEIHWLADAAADQGDQGDGGAPAVIRQRIEACAAAAGIVELIDGERHYEVFESCA